MQHRVSGRSALPQIEDKAIGVSIKPRKVPGFIVRKLDNSSHSYRVNGLMPTLQSIPQASRQMAESPSPIITGTPTPAHNATPPADIRLRRFG